MIIVVQQVLIVGTDGNCLRNDFINNFCSRTRKCFYCASKVYAEGYCRIGVKDANNNG